MQKNIQSLINAFRPDLMRHYIGGQIIFIFSYFIYPDLITALAVVLVIAVLKESYDTLKARNDKRAGRPVTTNGSFIDIGATVLGAGVIHEFIRIM